MSRGLGVVYMTQEEDGQAAGVRAAW
jgi:hypothetical protein